MNKMLNIQRQDFYTEKFQELYICIYHESLCMHTKRNHVACLMYDSPFYFLYISQHFFFVLLEYKDHVQYFGRILDPVLEHTCFKCVHFRAWNILSTLNIILYFPTN